MSEQSDDELFPAIYGELRRVAGRYLQRERRNHTLQPTALVHEAWLKLQNDRGAAVQGRTRGLALGAIAMRRLLVDHGRHQKREKRGGGEQPLAFDTLFEAAASNAVPIEDLLTLEEALSKLEALDARAAWLSDAIGHRERVTRVVGLCLDRTSCCRQKGVETLTVFGSGCDAHRNRLSGRTRERVTELAPHAPRDRDRMFGAGVSEEQNEVIRAESREHVAATACASQRARDRREDVISACLAELLLDRLQAHRLDVEKRRGRSFSATHREQLRRGGGERAPEGQFREVVV